MTCELWRDQIEPYIDGELASTHDAEVAAHLRVERLAEQLRRVFGVVHAIIL